MRLISRSLLCILAFLLSSVGQPIRSHAGNFSLTIEKGRMSASIDRESLREVMDYVSQKAGIVVFVDQSLLSSTVSARFNRLSIEDGLKKIVGTHSYAMVFSPALNVAGDHPVKAIRVYPKGQPEKAHYVMLNPSDQIGLSSATPEIMTLEEVDAVLERNEQITLSHTAQKIGERKNGKQVGNTPGAQSVVNKAIQRAKKIRRFKELKAATLARKSAYEKRTNLESQQTHAAKARSYLEHKRQEALRVKF